MIHVILLAAGYSSRFGSNKLLHIVDGTPMYRHALETAEQFRQLYCCEPVRLIFVTAYDDIGKQLREKDGFCLFGAAKAGNTAGRDLVVMNPNSGLGISHSIALGVKAAGADRFREDDSLMFMVCDQPWLTPGDLLNLAACFKRSGKSIGCMAYGEQTGNPVLFSAGETPAERPLSGGTLRRYVSVRYQIPGRWRIWMNCSNSSCCPNCYEMP